MYRFSIISYLDIYNDTGESSFHSAFESWMSISMALSSWLSLFCTMGDEGEKVPENEGSRFSASMAGIYCCGQGM